MVTFRRDVDGSLVIVNGNSRLRAMLELNATADITNIQNSGEILRVHEVSGELVVVSSDAQGAIEREATRVIRHASGK